MTKALFPRVHRFAIATLAAFALVVAPLIALAPAAQAAPPCDYNAKVYCDGGDEPAWQWDTIDDIACVQIPGATLDANDKPDYSKVVGKVYYKGALVWDSTPKAPTPPKKPKPKPTPTPTPKTETVTATKPTTVKSGSSKPAPTQAPTPTATPTVAPVLPSQGESDVAEAVDLEGTTTGGGASTGPNPGIFVLGGIVVAGAATLGVYALRRRRAALLA